jgi:hypothetical protein
MRGKSDEGRVCRVNRLLPAFSKIFPSTDSKIVEVLSGSDRKMSCNFLADAVTEKSAWPVVMGLVVET